MHGSKIAVTIIIKIVDLSLRGQKKYMCLRYLLYINSQEGT